jgi:hypothetical protein
MSKNLNQTLFWLPRLAGIAFVQLGFWGTVVGLFMHLIPSILLAVGIALAWIWKREWIGAVIFAGWAVFYLISVRGFDWTVYAIIAGIPGVVAALFWIGWVWRERIRE